MGGCSNAFSVLLVFAVLWTSALSNDKCSAGCKNSAGSPSFLNNHKYNYAVEGQVSIYLTGADKQETSVKLNGQATVAALGNCGYVLRVQNMQISGPDGKKYKSPPGMDKPVRFTMQDGKVGSEICTEDGDTRRSLNIKRAIISLLQSPIKQSTETDVFGICPTQVSSSQEGDAVLLHRSRDLSRCGMREQGRNDLFNGVFDPNAEIKDTQVLQSTLNVETKVKNGVPEKVAATEEYLYKPFSVGQNGARARVQTKLTLTGQSGGSDQGQFTEVRAIIFENPHGVKQEQSNLQTATTAFKETLAALQNGASHKTAGEFAQLVRIFRLTSKDDLQKLFGQAKGNKLGKRIYLDALLRAGTGASIELSIQLLKNKALDELEQKVVYLSLGNAKHVTNEALKAASTLLDVPNIPKEVYLGVGALAGTYCNTHQCHGTGSQSQGIAAISQKMAGKLHNCKAKNKIEEDYIVAALKGIRSIRHIEDTLVERLAQCVTDKNVKARVKVAALEAFRADPCTAKLKKVALDTMKNRQLDSEIRINAYLAVIACPCAKSANEIKNLLESEPVHQVGRYITTSLRHIRASANPDKALARQHYGLIRTPNKFEVDDRKYSFYREVSYDIDAFGVGGTAEQSVIFSQDSYLPRSANLNITAQLFGHSLNVFEIGGRQGNLDRVIEHFLGPKSFLRTQSPQEVYDNLAKTFSDASKSVEEKMRKKRELKKDIDAFDKQVKAEIAPFDDELDLDIYVKLFGSEAIFLSLGDDKGFNGDAILAEALKYLETGMNQAKNFQQDIRAHMLFLDAELAYPTSTGFALKLDLVGSAVGRFDISSKVDIRQIMKDPKNAKIDVKLVPSTDIEIAGIFLVDADVVATGLKVVTDFHTSTGGHLIAKLIENSGARGIDIQLGLPVDKQEIVHATNELVFVTREKGQKESQVALKIDMDRKDHAECFDQLSKVLGLTFCGEVSMPFSVSGQEAQASIQKFIARFPLTGPAKVKVHLEKNDLRGYHVKYLYHNNAGKQGFELLFDAEGEKSNRKSTLKGELINTNEEKSVLLSLQSPIKTAHGQISLIMKPNEYVGLVKAQLDEDQYYARAGFTVEGNDKRSVFKPIVEYQVPKQKLDNVKVDGQVVRAVNGAAVKYTLEGIKINMPNSHDVVDISGFFIKDKKSVVELKAIRGEHNAILKGSLMDKDFSGEFTNTLNPNVNFKLNGKSDNDVQKHHFQNDLDLHFGGDMKSDKHRVIFNQLLKFDASNNQFSLVTKNKLDIPLIPAVAKANVELGPKKVDIELETKYDKHEAELELKARTDTKHPGDYEVKVEAKVLDKGIEIVANRDIVDSDKSNFENSISIKGIGKYELSGVVTHKVKPSDVHVGANGHLKFRTGKQQDDIKFDFGYVQNPSLHSSHLKLNTDKSIVNYQFTVTRGPSTTGKLDITLLDYFSTNGNFKMTENDGKGNGGFIMHFQKADKKFKGDLKFLAKDPVFNAEVDLFLNFGKDDNDKFHFSTNNKYNPKKFDTQNKFVYGDKTTEVKLSGGQDNGKVESNFELVLPNKRVISYKFHHMHKGGDGSTLHSEGNLELADFPDKSQQPSKLTYKGKWDSDADKLLVNMEQVVEIQLKDNKNWVNKFVLKNTPNGDKKHKGEFKNEMTGTLMPAPFAASGHLDYERSDNIDGPANYQLKLSYGDKVTFNVEGKSDIALMGSGDKKYFHDFTITTILPFEKAHDFKYSSNVLLLVPENKETLLEYTLGETLKLNGEQYKFDANGKLAVKEGFSKVKLLVPHNEPFTLDSSYKNSEEGTQKSGEVDVKTTYGKGKTANFHVKGIAYSNYEYSVDFKSSIPQAEKLKKLELSMHSKNPTPGTFTLNAILDIDGQVYKEDSTFVFSGNNGLVDVKYSCPHSQPSRIYVKVDAAHPNQGKVEAKIENVREINFDTKAEGSVERDNIVLSAEGNSEKFGLKNYKVKISSKEAGNGKRLEFNMENDNKNILSGSTSFISKQEGQKTIIEGSGSVKLQNQQKSANFKYIRTILTEGNEQGFETFVNVAIGERSYVGEHRLTNLEHKMSLVYCEEKKQCAHVEFHAKANAQDQGFHNSVNINLDLRKLGIHPEFGLQLKNEIVEQFRLQSTLNVHLNKDDKKYHLYVYNKPRRGANIGYDSGIEMELPSRTLAMESSFSAGTNMLVFPVNGEVAMYMDKKKPQQKLSANMHMDLIGAEKQHSFKADFKFHHPKIPQDVGINVQSTLNHQNFDNFMFEGVVAVTNEGKGKGKVYFDVKPNHVKFFIETPLVKVIEAEGTIILKDNHQEGDFRFNLLEGKPVIMKAVNKDFQYFEFTTGYSEDANRKLSIISHIEVDKRIDISADIVLNGAKKNIGHGALFIENDLVKTDHGTSKENFEYFIKALKGDLDRLQERMVQLSEKAQADMKKKMEKYKASLEKVSEDYKQELEKLKHELVNDKTLQDIDKALNDVFHFFAHIVDDLMRLTTSLANTINQSFTETWGKINEMYAKEIKPQVDKIYANITSIVQQYVDMVVDLLTHFAAIFTEFVEKHKPELKELTNIFTDIFKSLTRILIERLKDFRMYATNVMNEVSQQVKEMPMVAMIKEKISEFSVPDRLVEMVNEVSQALQTVLPTQEARDLAEAIVKYLHKKIKNEKVDEEQELRIINQKLGAAFTSVTSFVKQQLQTLGLPTAFNLNFVPTFSSASQTWPTFGGSSSYSLVNGILTGDIPNPLAYIKAYRPRSINPLHEIPAQLRAVVVNGQHIFTFDGSHLTFPGNCYYVLAHDHVDRNFTLAIQLANGQPKAIALEVKSGEVIELKENGQVFLNGANHGFPINEKDIVAYKDTNGLVGLYSNYGVHVQCSANLVVCHFEVSGFYLGKLRGLLGDGNNEPFDDFRLPNGKIVTSQAEFGNAYKLQKSCPPVQTPEHSHHELHSAALPPACEEVFGGRSTLWPLAMFLDVKPFRQACIHAVASNPSEAKKEACAIAAGYTALAATGLLPAVMPPACLRCNDADSPKTVGEQFDIKLPTKQADVVVLVELTKGNEKAYKDIMVPVVSQVVDALKQKKIDDIKVHLIGITTRFPYPIIYDTENLKLKGAKITFMDESRHQPMFKPIHIHNEKADQIEDKIVEGINEFMQLMGATNVVGAYNRVLQLPLRAGAVKHTISLVSEHCKKSFFFVEIARMISVGTMFSNNAMTHSLITVTPDLVLGGGKNVQQLIGYDTSSVVLLGDKKKGLNTEQLRSQLKNKPDACVDFVEGTSGLIFSATNFLAMNPGQQKQFIQSSGQLIAERMTRFNIQQSCMCVYVDPFHVRSLCVKKDVTAARRRK